MPSSGPTGSPMRSPSRSRSRAGGRSSSSRTRSTTRWPPRSSSRSRATRSSGSRPMGPKPHPPPAALVTGASRGLGRGIAEALAGDGFDVAIHYATNRAAAEETQAACRRRAPRPEQRFVVVGGNVADAGDRGRIVGETLAALGRVDALVNNAGMAPRVRADILDATEESFDELIAVNLRGPYFLSQAVARHWLEHKGQSRLAGGYKLVFISSIAATHVSLNRGEYCVSKAGLAMASKLWAARLAPEGVQVFELRPGIMATDM